MFGQVYDVIQQPPDGSASDDPGIITQFTPAIERGAVGFIAHQNLDGAAFYDLSIGDVIWTVNDRGKATAYGVTEITVYQVAGDVYINQTTGESVHVKDLYDRIYVKDNLVLMTCYAVGDNPGWGRLVVIARPFSRVY